MNTELSALRYSLSYTETLGDKYNRNRIFVDLAGTGGRVLELGCNTGFISRHLAERGCRVTGVEIDSTAAAIAQKWCEKVLVCDLNQSGWTQKLSSRFETVMCGDVLEHLVEPARTLQELAPMIAPEGKVIICLPNIAHWSIRLKLLAGKFNYEPTGILDSTHLRF